MSTNPHSLQSTSANNNGIVNVSGHANHLGNTQQIINNYNIILGPQPQNFDSRQQENYLQQQPVPPQANSAVFPGLNAGQMFGNQAFGGNTLPMFQPSPQITTFNAFGVAQSIAYKLDANNFPAQFSITILNFIIQQQAAAQNVQNAIQFLNQTQQGLVMQLQLINDLQNAIIHKFLMDTYTLQQAVNAVLQLQLTQQKQSPLASPQQYQTHTTSLQGNDNAPQNQGASQSNHGDRQDSKKFRDSRMSGLSYDN